MKLDGGKWAGERCNKKRYRGRKGKQRGEIQENIKVKRGKIEKIM